MGTTLAVGAEFGGQVPIAVILAALTLSFLGFLLMGVYALLCRFAPSTDPKLMEDIRYLYRVVFFLIFSLLAQYIIGH